jgi:type 1 glutamine amidotransferase
MTTRIMRGPDWARLGTAMPDIIAGHYQGGRGQGRTSSNAAVPLAAFDGATVFDTLDRQRTRLAEYVEAASTQRVSAAISRNFDQNLADELDGVIKKLGGTRIAAYDAPLVGNLAGVRKLFEFACALKALVIVSALTPDALAALDTLSNEFGINVAIENRSRAETREYAGPKRVLAALNGLGKRSGACVNTGDWMEEGVDPLEGVRVLKNRLMTIYLADRCGMSRRAHAVPLGHRALGVERLPESVYRPGLQPAFLKVESSGSGDALSDLTKSFDDYNKALQPVAADRGNQLSRTTTIRGPQSLYDANRVAIKAAAPAEATAQPRKRRKLLVIDLSVAYPGRGSLPVANMAVALWGRKTSVYTTVVDSNLDSLKYIKINEFDAIFLDNKVGQIFPDAEVRKSLMQIIRAGGGLAAYHGASHDSINWTEFGNKLGARSGSRRDFHEKITIKIDDPTSPLTAAFDGKEFEWEDAFFGFSTPPYNRDKLHVLLNFDAEKTDVHQKPDCDICDRADNEITVSWLRSGGNGRIFYAAINHLPTLFATPTMAWFFLSAIQFALGDLDADTMPNARLTARGGR